MSRKAVPYVNDLVATRDFKYYIFDWDDNGHFVFWLVSR